jgi:hypothetical protein
MVRKYSSITWGIIQYELNEIMLNPIIPVSCINLVLQVKDEYDNVQMDPLSFISATIEKLIQYF